MGGFLTTCVRISVLPIISQQKYEVYGRKNICTPLITSHEK